jgi:hypothetical protein
MARGSGGGADPNNPSTGVDDSKFMRMGHTEGPYGNDPFKDARGEFGEPPIDLRP